MPYPSLLFIHGAASAAWVWEIWRRHLRPFGWETNVLDLRGHGRSLPVDFSIVTMEDYLADIESVTAQIAARGRHPVLVGWSMGGMLSLMYAARHEETPALVLLEPSPPLEVAGRVPASALRDVPLGVIGPEQYGIFVDDPVASRAVLPDLTDAELTEFLDRSRGAEESGIAHRQRYQGISVPAESVRCPTLLVYGQRPERAERVTEHRRTAEYLGARGLAIEGAGHWGLVYHEAAVIEAAMQVDSWLRRSLSRA